MARMGPPRGAQLTHGKEHALRRSMNVVRLEIKALAEELEALRKSVGRQEFRKKTVTTHARRPSIKPQVHRRPL